MNALVVDFLLKDLDISKTDSGEARPATITPNSAQLEKVLTGYAAFHHMLLAFARRHPEIPRRANEMVARFHADENARTKDVRNAIVAAAAVS